jgi:excisionase family DNA binding protein
MLVEPAKLTGIFTMPYTLGQAAKATGLSKPTLSEAIKKGKISAVKNENGSFSIDPAELHRVYPPVASPASKEEIETEHLLTHDLTGKIMVLEAQVKAASDLKDQIAAERDDLRTERNRLLGVIEQQAGTVKQLTHQPEPKEADLLPETLPAPAAGLLGASVRFWAALAIIATLVASLAAAWLWWERQR